MRKDGGVTGHIDGEASGDVRLGGKFHFLDDDGAGCIVLDLELNTDQEVAHADAEILGTGHIGSLSEQGE